MPKKPACPLPSRIIHPYLAASEHLLKSILAIFNPITRRLIDAGPLGGFQAHFFYLGLSDKYLHVVESDVWSKPLQHSKFEYSSVGPISIKRGLTADRLLITLPTYGTLKLQVPKPYSQDARHMVSILELHSRSPAA